jgi:hypothetical protein
VAAAQECCHARPEQPHLCRFVFCHQLDAVPLRYMPLLPATISSLVARFAAAADIRTGHKELRSGLSFVHVVDGSMAGKDVGDSDGRIAWLAAKARPRCLC